MAESDTQEKKKDLENTKELVDEFEGILNAEIRQQKREEYKRSELPGKYMALQPISHPMYQLLFVWRVLVC